MQNDQAVQRIVVGQLINRVQALQVRASEHQEMAEQMSYVSYLLDDIRQEGPHRSDESNATLLDIQQLCGEFEAQLDLAAAKPDNVRIPEH